MCAAIYCLILVMIPILGHKSVHNSCVVGPELPLFLFAHVRFLHQVQNIRPVCPTYFMGNPCIPLLNAPFPTCLFVIGVLLCFVLRFVF
jgi:hypothetical protein